jgi:hypothetical protein
LKTGLGLAGVPTGVPTPRWWPFRVTFLVLTGQLILVSLASGHSAVDAVDLVATVLLAWTASLITGQRRDFWLLLLVGVTAPLLDLVEPWASAPFAVNVVKDVIWLLFPLILAQRLFVTIYGADEITLEELAGAISVYFLIGIFFASLFELYYLFDPNAIQWGANFAGGDPEFGDFVYFSFVTMASVGYGDVAPASALARITVVMEAVVGLMYLAILVARFVTMHTGRPGPGEGREA